MRSSRVVVDTMKESGVGTGAIIGIIVVATVVPVTIAAVLIGMRSGGVPGAAGELTIASFESEVDNSVSPYLSLYASGYGVTGNTIWCNGTVSYVGSPGTYGSGATVDLSINWKVGERNVNVSVYLHSGFATHIYPSGTQWDSNTADVPTLGAEGTSYPQSFNFSLNAAYT